MARYIDAYSLAEKLGKTSIYKKSGYLIENESEFARGFESAVNVIKGILCIFPTEDVVPRSEVEELQKKLDDYKKFVGEIRVTSENHAVIIDTEHTEYIDKRVAEGLKNMAVKQAEQEVAREIFEEIVKEIEDAMDFVSERYKENENIYFQAKFVGLNQARYILIDKKKKYIGEEK